MKKDKDVLAEALERLEKAGLSQQPPKAVVEETIRRLGEAQAGAGGREAIGSGPRRHRQITLGRMAVRLLPAAAALIVLGYAIGRLSRPAPLDMEQLRAALAPSVAAAIEPAIRERLLDDMQQRYQLALAATYVKMKEELTEQYRDELDRYAVQMLAASNAVTNRMLAEVVENIDTMQTQDLKQVARALHRIELNRVQDKTQFAVGLQRLASQTEGELSRTRQQFVHLLTNYQPEDLGPEPRPLQNPSERNQP